MKFAKIGFLFISCNNQFCLSGMQEASEELIVKTSIIESKNNRPKIVPSLLGLSLEVLTNNIKNFDETSKTSIAHDQRFQNYFLENTCDNNLKKIYFEAANFPQIYTNETIQLLEELPVQLLIKLNNNKTLDNYIKLKSEIKKNNKNTKKLTSYLWSMILNR